MAVSRPLVLLDVDGVLNPYAAAACPAGFVEHRLLPDDDEPVRVCAQHGEWLCALSAHADLVWASSWGSEANRLLGPLLGLPDLPFLPMPAAPFPPAAKVPVVAAAVGDRRVAWLDDELTDEAYEWAAARGAGRTLLVPVDPAIGLTTSICDTLQVFACEPVDDAGADFGGG